MSRTIDEKVVEMRFDNQDFERNVSQSMSTLDKLKNALDFSGVDKTFSGLTNAANKLDLGSVGDAIENVGSKFTWLETIATGALLNIGASIETYLTNQLKGLTIDNVTAGFDKYADKTKAVQTIMNATGKEIGEVSNQLDRLNWYTDETSYDFTEMVASIGKFTSAGVDLETAVTSMEGIANWAGISGAGKQEANRAMYNISQALAAGYVRLIDWKSIENANMATAEFKKMAIDVAERLGTLESYINEETGALEYAAVDAGGHILESGITWQSFSEGLTKGKWLTTDVLNAVLDKYGAFTDRLSQIYDEWNSNPEIDITTSQIIKLANQYKDGSIDMEQAIAMTGQAAEDLIPILEELSSDEYDLGRKAFAAAQEAKTFQEAIDATKDAVSTQWMNTFEILFGNYEEAKVLWTDLANELWDIFAGPLSDMNDMLSAWKTLDVGGREDFIEGLKNIYRALRSVVDPISEAWEEIFPSLTFTRLGEIVAGFKNFTESLILNEEQMSAVGSAFEGVFKIIKIISDAAKDLAGTFLTNAFSGFDSFTDTVFRNIQKVGDYLDEVIHILPRMKSAREAFAEGQSEALNYIQKWEKTEAFIQGLSDVFDKLKSSAETLGDLASKFLNLRDATNAFYQEGGGLSGLLEVIVRRIADVVGAAEDLIHIWTGVDISKWVDPVVKTLFNFQEAIKSVQQEGWFTKIKDDLIGVGTAFTETFGGFREFFGPVFDALGKIVADWVDSFSKLLGGGKTDLEGFFETIDNGLVSLQDFIKTNETLKSIMDGIKDTIKIISDFAVRFLSIGDAMKAYEEAGGGLAGIFAIINEKIQAVLDLIGTLIERFTGLDLSEVGNGILLVIKVIEEGFVRLADRIAQLFGWKDNPFHTLLETSESSFTKLQELFAKFGGMDTSGFTGLGEKLKESFDPIGSVLGGIGKVIQGVWSLVQAVLPLIGQGLSWFGDVLVSFSDKLKGMSFREILDIVKIILTIVRIKQFIDIFDGFGDVLDEVSDSLKAFQAKLRAEAFEAIGRSILMVAAAIVAISLVPTETLKTSLLAIAAVLIALTVSIRTISDGLSKMFTTSSIANIKSIQSFATMLASLGATFVGFGTGVLLASGGLGLLTLALKNLTGSQEEWQKLGELGAALGGITLALGLISHFATGDHIAQSGLAILEISAAIAILTVALKGLEKVDWGSVGKLFVALVVVEGLTTAMVALINLSDVKTGSITKFAEIGSGMLGIAAGMAVFVAVLKMLDGIKLGTLLTSLGKLLIIFVGFGVLAAVTNKFCVAIDHFADILLKFGKALLYLGLGIGVLGIIAKVLGDDAQEIAESAVDLLVTVLDAIVSRADDIAEDLFQFVLVVLDKLAEHTPEIVAKVIEIIGGIFQAVREAFSQGDFGLIDFAGGAGVIGGLIGIVILINKAKITAKDFAAAALVLAGAAGLLVELGALFIGIGALANKVGGLEQLEGFKTICDAIVAALVGVEGDENRGGVLGLFAALIGLVTMFALIEQKLSGSVFRKESFAKDIGKAFGDVTLILTEVSGLMVILGTLLAATGIVYAGLDWLASKTSFGGVSGMMEKAGEFYSAITDLFAENGAVALMLGALIALEVALIVLKDKFGIKIDTESIRGSFVTIGAMITSAMLLLDVIGVLLIGTGAAIDLLGGVDTFEAFMQKAADFYNAIADLFVENGAVAIMLGAFVALEAALIVLKDKFGIDINPKEAGLALATLSIVLTGAIAVIDVIGGLLIATGAAINGTGMDNVSKWMGKATEFYNAIADLFVENGAVAIMLGAFVALEISLAAIQTKIGGAAKAAGKTTSMAGSTWSAFGTLISVITESVLLIDALGGLFAATGVLVSLIDFGVSWGGNYDNSLVGWINKAGEFFEAIANAIGKFIGGFIGGAAGSALGGVVDSITEDRIAKLTDAIERITKTVAVISTLANGTYNGATLNFDDVKEFGNTLKNLGGNLKSYYGSIENISVSKMNKMSEAILNTVDAATVITEFKKSISEGLGSIKEMFESTIGDLLEAIEGPGGSGSQIGNPKKFYDAGVKLVTSFSNGLTYDGKVGNTDSPVAKMKSSFRDMILGLLKVITDDEIVSEFQTAGSTLIGYIITGMESIDVSVVAGSIAGIASTIVGEESLSEFQKAGYTLMSSVVTGMNSVSGVSITESISGLAGQITGTEVVSKFQNAGSTLMNAVGTGMQSVDTTAIANSIGSNMTAGVAQGMNNQESLAKVTKAAEKVITKAKEAAETKAQIASPSKLFAVIGKFLDEGLAEGIFENIPVVKDAAASVISAIADNVSGESIIDMMKGYGFNISDTFGASILEASEDVGDYGGLISQMFSEGLFSNLSDTLGMDVIEQFLSGIGVSLPDVTAIIEEYGVDISEAGLEGMSEYLNADYGQELLNGTVVDGMGGALTYAMDTAHGYGEDVGEAWSDGYDMVMSETAKEFENTEIQGPTVVFFADMDQVEEAMEKFAYFGGKSFDKYGELDAYLLAFDMQDEKGKQAYIDQARWDWQNEELANELTQRMIQNVGYATQDAYWQNMAENIDTSDMSMNVNEENSVTREDLDGLKTEMSGLREDIRTIGGTFVNANVYLDTGELVGAMAPRLDQEFGNLQKLGERGI